MNAQEFCGHLDELFEVDPGTVQLTDKLQSLPEWDSLMFLSFLSMVDTQYNVTLSPKTVLSSQSIHEIYNTIATEVNVNRAA